MAAGTQVTVTRPIMARQEHIMIRDPGRIVLYSRYDMSFNDLNDLNDLREAAASTTATTTATMTLSARAATTMIVRLLLLLLRLLLIAVVSAVDDRDDLGDDDPFCPKFAGKEEVGPPQRTLNVHVVPHTHDDVGWLKTVDQYFHGWNNTIQDAHVKLILDSVLASLSDPLRDDRNRTFTYVESKFFAMWYETLPPPSRTTLLDLISRGRFAFVNGGWSMHDEANTHYVGMIDNTALGHRFLREELGVVPRVGWQIDPFGHSSTQGGLMTRGVGFDALYFGRIHHADLANRRKNAECEGLWSASASDPDDAVFWGLTGSYGGNYGGPEGFCFDVLCDATKDETLEGISGDVMRERIHAFADELARQASETKGGNLLLTMGMDFFYSEAERNFANLDLLIEATDRHFREDKDAIDIFSGRYDGVNIFYSTPERYTRCKYADFLRATAGTTTAKTSTEKQHVASTSDGDSPSASAKKYDPATWRTNVKTGDFFPYADCDHCYWSGYFSSRQGLKRQERVASSFLHAARQIESMMRMKSTGGRMSDDDSDDGRRMVITHADAVAATEDDDDAGGTENFSRTEGTLYLAREGTSSWNTSPLFLLEDASGIAQHHDAVAGTAKQHVAYDYSQRLAKGMEDASAFVTDQLRGLLIGPQQAGETILENLSYCHLLNETICDISQEASRDDNKIIYVVVYNALSNARTEIVPLPVDSSPKYAVERLQDDMTWLAVDSSLFQNHNYVRARSAAKFTLYFNASELPPLGAAVFRIATSNEKDAFPAVVARSIREINISSLSTSHIRPPSNNIRASSGRNRFVLRDNDLIVSNGMLSVVFDRYTGIVKTISELRDGGISLSITQEYGFYKSAGNGEVYGRSEFFRKMCLRNKWLGKACKIMRKMCFHDESSGQTQNGGAYIFRPTSDQTFEGIFPGSAVVYESDLVTEVHTEFGDPAWIKQITRLTAGMDFVEVEYVVGPVPIDDGVGKEVVSKYLTTVESHGVFYTDSNGREFIKRNRGDTGVFGYKTEGYDPGLEPVAANYFPVNAAMFIEDESQSFTVLVDRSQGGSSMSNGALELMIQRRLLYDDARGVGEPLNETDSGITSCPPYGNSTRLGRGVITKGSHRLMIGKNGASQARSQMDKVFSQPHIFVASTPKDIQIPFHQPGLSMLKASLPKNVMIVTFSVTNATSTFLVRLAHQYGLDEDSTYSSPAYVDMQDLFPYHQIAAMTEMTLSANQVRADWEKQRIRWIGNKDDSLIDDWNTIAVLKPLEIRTFEVVLKPLDYGKVRPSC